MLRHGKSILHKLNFFLALLLIVILAVYAYITTYAPAGQDLTADTGSDAHRQIVPLAEALRQSDLAEAPRQADLMSGDGLNSPNAILVRLEDNTVLMRKNSEQRIYPASLTKIMTTLVAIEELNDPEKEIELPNAIFQELYKADASMAGFVPGEKVRAIDLLYGIMLPSGAECCAGLAEYISGSERQFVGLMNKKASDLGMDNTHFTNTTGLQDENHYTTVKDLAKLLSYALKNDVFRKIFTASRYSTPPTNKHPEGITFYSTMFKNMNDPRTEDGRILGGKTGYTAEAGLCLASLARIGGKEYILVTAGADGDHETEQFNITDAKFVYDKLKNTNDSF